MIVKKKNTHVRVDKAKVRLPLPHNGCMISHSGELGVKEAFIFFPPTNSVSFGYAKTKSQPASNLRSLSTLN